MRVLITRPRDDARAVAAALADRGVETLIEPLLEITPLPADDFDLAGVQAVLLTSANGARALARASAARDPAVLAVGEATARAAREAGFSDVAVGDGDVAALAALAEARCAAKAGPLLHVSGRTTAGDLAGRLARAGFTVRRAVLYEARTATALSPAARAAFADGAVDAVLLFSPRTAKTFVTLALEAGLAAALGGVAALCLSPAVAAAACALRWREVRIADRPDQASLLALVAPTSE
ncbi:MAG: uroporphyrinogen-III synthase [Alphaproteobacteria bacterium]